MFSSTKTRSRPPLRDTPEIGSSTGRRAVSGSDRLPSSTLPVSEPSGRVSRSNEGDREALVGSVQGVHDDELASRVIRAYRTFARVGLLGEASCGGPMAAVTERLVGGLWSTVLGLPEGLRPVLTQKAGTALRLAIELGLPIVSSSLSRSEVLSASRNATTGAADALYLEEGSGWEFNNREGECILRGLIDISSAQRRPEVARDAVVVAGAPGGITKGALFYRRFSDIIHDALLRTGGGGERPLMSRKVGGRLQSLPQNFSGVLPGSDSASYTSEEESISLMYAGGVSRPPSFTPSSIGGLRHPCPTTQLSHSRSHSHSHSRCDPHRTASYAASRRCE